MWSVVVEALSLGLQQSWAQSLEKSQTVSLCEVKAHPEKFLHKLIEITATASHGFEDSMVEDGQCPWPKGGPGIWLEYGGTRSTDTMYAGGGSPKPDREKPLVVEGIPVELVDDQISGSSTNSYIQSIQSQNEGPTLSGPLCVADYSHVTKASGERR
jgi:hypothetical protein